ncbi:DNA helicase RecQ [Pontibacter sp. G13]|uniref:DNA helicase RecQ n=1 Tax=Pontibacter sp. G13 TaxID=3074898 RepID=UPI002889FEDD|nr:DNA helicase RecQ [Pontibacter sp. G13]WNJ17947.1 DNA helicase RecQ [Pontibacter sp. G13]
MDLQAAQVALKNTFGYDEFRPLQAEIITSILEGHDTLVLMPTGGGKSMCFQIPAIIQNGMCVVISPLIALMHDQVESLKSNGVQAAYLNSSQTFSEQQALIEEIMVANIKLLYVSPEKLLSQEFQSIISRVKVSLFAIDEAHCISSWGHDFRPEYTQLKLLKQNFPDTPVVALTATADKATREDIVSQLGMRNPNRFVASFDRPNLSLTVRPANKRVAAIIDFVRLRPNQSGIIYCLSRKSTEDVAAKLRAQGMQAEHYHAGMDAAKRHKVQEAFIHDRVPIICATIAFGMGIDKSNVRWVIHYNLPKNLEGYYQEIGRAGRDGLPSDTLLFYSYGDVFQLRKFAEDSGQSELMIAKLERMQQYAQAQVCRRRVLLGYFGDHPEKDCGNCDVCQDPPQRFDGTVIAQKALSAVYRLREQVGMGMLIDVLRGSAKKEITEKGYHQIKTYGAGADMNIAGWQSAILQLLDQGLLEIAYQDGHSLKLTAQSRSVLFDGKPVQMVRAQDSPQPVAAAKRIKPKSQKELFQEALFESLRKLRRKLAEEEGRPPYLVFNDASLEDMARKIPTSEPEMRSVSGVGESKWQTYGSVFIDHILGFIQKQSQTGDGPKLPTGTTHLVTYQYYREGKSVDEISQARQIGEGTVIGHLAKLYDEGYPVKVKDLILAEEIAEIQRAKAELGELQTLKPYYEFLEGTISYGKIKLGLILDQQASKA